jgi:hypothetical protein
MGRGVHVMSRSITNDYDTLRNPEGTPFYPNQWENSEPELPKSYTIVHEKVSFKLGQGVVIEPVMA